MKILGMPKGLTKRNRVGGGGDKRHRCERGRENVSRSETWVPKRGGLKAAGKRQESATFLQRSFFDVAVQFFVCCSAAFGPNCQGVMRLRLVQ